VAHNSSLTHKGALKINSSTGNESLVRELGNVRRRERGRKESQSVCIVFWGKKIVWFWLDMI